ncbi:MAG: histidine phosphatase family protein [Oscillospiraceae bacterium]|nr:histidine phosphatase family protein [Oscillospiraceae bacterium]
MRIFIIRHAESYSNTQGRMMSTTDLPLTEKGVQQATAAKLFFEKSIGIDSFKHVFCSPLLRAKQTANIISGGQTSIIECDLLKEMDLGALEGLTWQERADQYPHIDMDKALADIDFPSGENYDSIEERCNRFIKEYLVPIKADENVLIVTHGITKRVIVNCLLHKKRECVNYLNWCDNCSFSEIEFDGINSRIIRLNERSYLISNRLGTEGYDIWGMFSDIEYNLY